MIRKMMMTTTTTTTTISNTEIGFYEQYKCLFFASSSIELSLLQEALCIKATFCNDTQKGNVFLARLELVTSIVGGGGNEILCSGDTLILTGF
jgi:hypothetical protein